MRTSAGERRLRFGAGFKVQAGISNEPTAFIVRNSFVNHSDHRFTGQATIDAIYPSARDRLNFPETSDLKLHFVADRTLANPVC